MEASSKRKRTSSGPTLYDLSPSHIQRSSAVWFDDGNIILQAEDLSFRVHKSVLALHSSILGDMLLLTGPVSVNEHREGCPVVKMEGDLASEWGELLLLIYHGYRKTRPGDGLSFAQISAMLRLGHKYCFDSYRTEALERFTEAFGTEWDIAVINDQGDIDTDRMYMDDSHSWSDVVNLAYDLRLKQSLPLIYLNAIAHEKYPAYLFEGTKSKDGSISYVNEDVRRHLLCCQDNLYDAIRRYSFSWMYNLKADSVLGDRCSKSDFDCHKALISIIKQTYTPKPQVVKALSVWDELDSDGFCDFCRETAQMNFDHGRDNLWESLPFVFGLPSWDVLESTVDSLD